jgi:hypothetical protein
MLKVVIARRTLRYLGLGMNCIKFCMICVRCAVDTIHELYRQMVIPNVLRRAYHTLPIQFMNCIYGKPPHIAHIADTLPIQFMNCIYGKPSRIAKQSFKPDKI